MREVAPDVNSNEGFFGSIQAFFANNWEWMAIVAGCIIFLLLLLVVVLFVIGRKNRKISGDE